MSILILTCKCGQQMKVPEDALGKTGTCVLCGMRLKITKRNTGVFIDTAPRSATPPPLPVEGERPLTDAQKITQALTSRGVQTPPDWEELENLYAATEKAATRRAGRRKVLSWLTVVSLALLCIIAFAARTGKQETQQTAERTSHPIREPVRSAGKPARDVAGNVGLSFVVMNEDVYDAPVKTQVTSNVLVSGQVSRSALETLLRTLYSSTRKRRGFKFHESPTHIFIYAYTSREHAESGMGQWIAMLSRIGENAEAEIAMNDRQLSQVGAAAEERFGLSEAKRKQIFSEIVKAEDRADREGEAKYPLSDLSRPGDSESFLKQVERYNVLKEKLREKYYDELAAQYGLTRQQLDEVRMEGMTKGWPFPRY